MRIPTMVAVLMVSLPSIGCGVSTIQPLYTNDTSVTEPEIVGTWLLENANATLSINAQGAGYQILFISPNKSASYSARIVELGGRLFLDCWSTKPSGSDAVPIHHIFRIVREKDTLRVAAADRKKVHAVVGSNEETIAFANVDDGQKNVLVLTGTTVQLQAFFQRHESEIFLPAMKFTRQRGERQIAK